MSGFVFRSGDPENVNDLGEVFVARCWTVSEALDWPKPGDKTLVAVNSAADTDMGNLYGDEFARFFPGAIEITKDEYLRRHGG